MDDWEIPAWLFANGCLNRRPGMASIDFLQRMLKMKTGKVTWLEKAIIQVIESCNFGRNYYYKIINVDTFYSVIVEYEN